MSDVLTDLKHRARRLHRAAMAGDAAALARLRRHPELRARTLDDPTPTPARRHCLAVIAHELGLRGWSHLTAVIEGREESDFGTLLHQPACSAHTNVWSASYEEARGIRAAHGGYLLPYRHQFVIVDRHYVESLGLDPDDADWEAIGRDFARPRDVDARRRLVTKLVVAIGRDRRAA